ncbi:UNVERIFIED_CONTAM: hypothetical protein Sindi_2314800 [Sesamum indicum]
MEGYGRWLFYGKTAYFHHLKEFAHSVWPALREVMATANGFFFFQFKTKIDMEDVIEGGPWLFQGQPIVLQKWKPGMAMRKLKHIQVPVWIKLRHLPMEFWTTEGLSIVASGVGNPLYPDAITRACTRLDFARVCVMIDVTQKIQNHIVIMTPDEDGGETPCKIDIEYEWLPPKCTGCMTLGHSVKECTSTKPQKQTKPPVKVYVPKTNVLQPPAPKERQKKRETMVEVTWDDDVVDVHILELGNQFVHCRVTNRADSESLTITVVYGASEMIDRRSLWNTLETLAREQRDDPWLNIWQYSIIGVPMFAVIRKLKALKPVFREQRRKKGDLTLNVQLAKGFLDEAQQLVSNDRQNEALLQLEHCCRLVYAKAVKLEQIMLQQRAKIQWMKEGEIINEFVHYYQNLLGGNRRQILIDIGFLKPWARHILSNEEASHLISIFTPDDVKQAVFDIAEDKAPGPDGYSSGFFKAAWQVVGQEVTKAVLDFFKTGKLLKQVNSTILALIPKGAFIPGRSIGDNILLAQELFTGYNQMKLPPRCALKVDIRKAYDTVEWDFLLAVLQLFGFPRTFTKWIEECVTTASFSIGLNGNPHGFLAGARGLRQGDPLSPYLFLLVMEVLHLGFLQLIEQDMQFTYHWKCESAKVFLLGFADDLLLFCRADLDSLRVLKMGLDRFAEWSGLRLNVQKSHVIISRSAQGWTDQILAAIGFQEGHLPMKYFGIPLLSSRLSIADCQPLLLKIDARIKGWDGISLSYAGRVQIIKSVLSAMSIYWASAFILPKAIIKQIEKRLRNFLWKSTYTSGYAKVAWKDVCKPIVEGGQGIKDIDILNRALMAKKLCDVIRCDRTSIWVEWLKHGRLRDNSIWAINEKGGSWGWRKLL